MKRRLKPILTAAMMLVAIGSPARTDQWPWPQAMDLESADGSFRAHIDYGSSLGGTVECTGEKRGQRARAKVTGPAGEVWTYDLLNPTRPIDAVLLDDGRLLSFDNWHKMGYGEVMVLYGVTGEVLWQRELEDLLAPEILGQVMRSVSSRWWRRDPLELSWVGDGEDLAAVVTLRNEHQLSVRLSDGEATYIEVDELPADPLRLESLARELKRRGETEEATRLYRRLIEIVPVFTQVYEDLASIHTEAGDHDRAIAVLRQGVAANPAGKLPSSEGAFQSNPKLGLLLELARAYDEAGRTTEAEETYLRCLTSDEGFWQAGKGLARLWLRDGRRQEADEILERFYHLKRGDPDASDGDHHLYKASREVAEVYEGVDPAKARDVYLRAYDKWQPDHFVALGLAGALERLGELGEAREVLENLIETLRVEGQDAFIPVVEKQLEGLGSAATRERGRDRP